VERVGVVIELVMFVSRELTSRRQTAWRCD